MQTIDVTGLTCIGQAKRGPWLLDGNRILKTDAAHLPLQTYSQAKGVFDAYRVACEAGAQAPCPLEIVRVGDGYGVVVEYVKGLDLLMHIAFGSYSPREAGEALGLLLRQAHALKCASARDFHATFTRRARLLATFLSPCIAEKLVSQVADIPQSNTFLHGDVHTANVIVSAGKPRLIDYEYCGFGHPVFDLAIVRTRLLLNHNALGTCVGKNGKPLAQDVWDACLKSYFQEVTPDYLEEMDKRTAVLAEIEHCCFKYGLDERTGHSLSERQQARIELCSNRLDGLLSHVDRLDFE